MWQATYGFDTSYHQFRTTPSAIRIAVSLCAQRRTGWAARQEMLAVRAREGIQDDVSQWKLNDDPNWLEHFFDGFVCNLPSVEPPTDGSA